MGPDAMILVFWMLSFKPAFSLSSFTSIKRLFRSSSLSAIRVVSSAYLKLLIFLPAILIPACASSSSAFDYRTSTGLGKQTLRRHKQNLVHPRSQEKGAVSPQETDPDLPVSVQESWVEEWVNSGLLCSQGTEYNSACISPFEGDCHYLHYPYHSLASD